MKNKIKTNENASKVKFVNKSKMICKFFVCCLSFVILIVCCLTIFNYTNNTQTSLAENNKIVKSCKDVTKGDKIKIRFTDGTIGAVVD